MLIKKNVELSQNEKMYKKNVPKKEIKIVKNSGL